MNASILLLLLSALTSLSGFASDAQYDVVNHGNSQIAQCFDTDSGAGQQESDQQNDNLDGVTNTVTQGSTCRTSKGEFVYVAHTVQNAVSYYAIRAPPALSF